ncbi:type II toxin-antitoxin system RelE/ParE family toxin [Spirosoma sp. BT702]|uniref:Type II toxin-antitoxin system RelE/ParE family toxin n=1 Tax=Spirosoma profusum TaxID=2771354 RepID=A0A927ASJ6_9BACT|nr:type II toxin-antitoxin system RelE/ParE family toxin [Spirosoma profusum]MBD2703976.1 type II toxin-antitoxin system RelE/ParE family toxin [Spirosoma profusum]
MTLIWNDEAKVDVRKAYSDYYNYSSSLADDWSDELAKKVELLLKFPEMGRRVPKFEISFIREVFVRKYRLVYQFQNNIVRILGVRAMGQPLGRF